MLKSNLLHIELLKYVMNKNNYFGFVEINDFLLKNFPEEKDLKERKKMKDFLNFLESEEYIKTLEKKGIWILKEAGIEIKRNEISAIIKIMPKGINLLEQYQMNSYNKIGIILSSILGITTILLTIYSSIISHNNKELEFTNNVLIKENIFLKQKMEIQKKN